MVQKRTYDREGHAHFVTFSCSRRRKLLQRDRAKRIVLGVLTGQLARQNGRCIGFVVMPDHVHIIVWLPAPDQLSVFLNQWKRRSSYLIRRHLAEALHAYCAEFDESEPIWQARCYDFNVFTRQKIEEKLAYMHENPVRAGLVEHPCQWPWSSARYYLEGRPVGVPVGWLD